MSAHDEDERIRRLAASIYRERVRRARSIPAAQKLFSGIDLFDEVCDRMRAGVQMNHPEADATEVDRILRERMARLRRLEEARWKTATR